MAKSSRKERREKTRYEEDLKEVLPEHIQIKLDGQEFPLHLKERLFIPAGTEVLVNAKVGRIPRMKASCVGLVNSVSSVRDGKQIAVAIGIVKVIKQQAVLGISNLGSKGVSLPAGALIGVVTIMGNDTFDLIPIPEIAENKALDKLAVLVLQQTEKLAIPDGVSE